MDRYAFTGLDIPSQQGTKKTSSQAERAGCQSILFYWAPAVRLLQRQTTAYALGLKSPSDTNLFSPPRVAIQQDTLASEAERERSGHAGAGDSVFSCALLAGY
ncbi:MAG: hypothetical protein A3C82_01200 [Candidatus Wildermuthbacteria bacterium RIFCSPHIGHO2_02_FULL_47_12]|uniref:Uncharacterized protein n=1 Tax=Candidatus Wildermuthbacteria bacterium RIFCSPHIGHO2_02_FULL_47_12 TaxID=1802451 RepID=A0A1G2R3Q9_9BACT|nr:MAG: hypothetical protein A3C82_01200 [Candidatus Wildermuthbacteria bacterium RIFCSPHIGHO2_02_FULL_47_12]